MARSSVRQSDELAALEAQRTERRKALGQQIRSLRGDMTQGELGVALAHLQPDGRPIPQTTVSRWEQGLVDLTAEQIWDLEEALNLTHGDLGIAVGYVVGSAREKARGHADVIEAVKLDPRIDRSLQKDVIANLETFIRVSNTMGVTKAVRSGSRTASRS